MRKLIGISVLAICLVLPCAALSSQKHCINPREVEIGAGKSPTGEKWRVLTYVRSDRSCEEWSLDFDFKLPPIMDWATGTGIPAGGHISRYFKIYATEFRSEAGTEAVLAGYVGREVATIKVWMENGTMMEIHPRFPSMKLRKDFVWLRSFRYFVDYFPAESTIAKVALFTRGGRLVYRTRSDEGSFW